MAYNDCAYVYQLQSQYMLEMDIDQGVEGAEQAKLEHDLWMDPFVTAVDRLSEMIENPVSGSIATNSNE